MLPTRALVSVNVNKGTVPRKKKRMGKSRALQQAEMSSDGWVASVARATT